MRNDKKCIRMNTTEIHYSLWGVLTEVDRICKANAIPYTLIFGSLLGCVRDGGFIPWDDDVDIAILPVALLCSSINSYFLLFGFT